MEISIKSLSHVIRHSNVDRNKSLVETLLNWKPGDAGSKPVRFMPKITKKCNVVASDRHPKLRTETWCLYNVAGWSVSSGVFSITINNG